MFPNVIPESVISRFKYWDDTVKEGMFFQNRLYTPIRRFNSKERLAAYDMGCQISGQGVKVCISVVESGARSGYVLWQELRSHLLSPSTSQIC